MDPEFKFIDEVTILRHLSTLLGSKYFSAAPRLGEFLRFVVTETIGGRGNQLKEYSIGVNVYGRRSDFDPKQDSIVRVEAVKLRARLTDYYDQTNNWDGIRILLPKGGYVPILRQIGSQYDSSTESRLIGELCAAGELAIWRRTPVGTTLARQHFSRVIELAPSDPRGHIGWAYTCGSALDAELENPAKIIPLYEEEIAQSLKLSPTCSSAHVLLSNLISATGDIGPRAMAEVDAALRLEPGDSFAHFWRGGLLAGQGNFTEAIRHMHEAIRLAPLSVIFHAYLGRALFLAGKHEQAAEKLVELTRLDPTLSVAHLWLALALSESGRVEEATAVASTLADLADNSVTRSCMCYILARAGYRNDAARILETLVPPLAQAYVSPVWLASIFMALGEQNKAADQLESAKKENSYALIWQCVDPRLKEYSTIAHRGCKVDLPDHSASCST